MKQRSRRGKQWKAYVKGLRAMVRELKTDVACMDCGEVHPAFAMDFDHRDPSDKRFNISRAAGLGVSVESLMAEIDKCDVVCAVCHRYRTHGVRRVSLHGKLV